MATSILTRRDVRRSSVGTGKPNHWRRSLWSIPPSRVSSLKRRLYAEGLKEPICELCGQDEHWRGTRIALILDHINGVRDDNRIENLRIVCPNCAASLDTHCGRSKPRKVDRVRECARCGKEFRPKYRSHRFCSRECGQRLKPGIRGPKPERRKVERPPYERLMAEIKSLGWCGVGRKYGVSDNAIRKWVKTYERDPTLF